MAKKPNKKPTQPVPAVKQASKPEPERKEPKSWSEMLTTRNLCILLGALSFLLYANTLVNGYAIDDVMVLKDNLFVKKGISAIPELLSTPHMRGYLVIPNDLYRPLSLVMFAVEYQFFGPTPAVGHFFNIIVFMGCVITFFIFLNKFFDGKKTAVAFIAAVIFAVHPIHTEVVANIKSRDELLCFFFAFLSLNLFMNYMKNGKAAALAGGTIVLFLSLISKETVITFLAVIPVLFFIYNNENKKRAAVIFGGAVVATALFMVIRTVVLSHYNANQPGATTDFIDNALVKAPSAMSRLATEVLVMGKYLYLMFIPYPLLSNHSFNSIPFVTFANVWVILTLLAYGFIIWYAVSRLVKMNKDPWAFAILFYLATLSLFSNFPFLMGAEMAERFAFFASVGICIAAALAIEKWVIKEDATDILWIKNNKVLVVLVPLVVVFGGMTFARNADWKDEYTLFKRDVEKSPNDCRLYQYLGTALSETVYFEETDTNKQKQIDDEALGYLRKALEIYPDFAEAHVELGRVFDRKRMFDSAERHDLRALALNPNSSTANNNIGSVYITTGRYREAIVYLLKSVAINPNFKFVYLNLANCYMQVKQYDSALMYYNVLLSMDPNYIEAYQKMGNIYFQKQSYDTAALYYLQVLKMKPDDADATNNAGAAFLNARKTAQAIEYFKKAIAINPNYLSAYSNLGRAYYFSGQYQAAIEIFTKEFSLNQKNGIDVPFIALSYQKLGNMDMARKYEAVAKSFYANFKLE